MVDDCHEIRFPALLVRMMVHVSLWASAGVVVHRNRFLFRYCRFVPSFPILVVMQQVDKCGEEDAAVDVQFTDLPNALIACRVPEDLFSEGGLKVRTKLRVRWV